jgi:hypothetical protein
VPRRFFRSTPVDFFVVFTQQDSVETYSSALEQMRKLMVSSAMRHASFHSFFPFLVFGLICLGTATLFGSIQNGLEINMSIYPVLPLIQYSNEFCLPSTWANYG